MLWLRTVIVGLPVVLASPSWASGYYSGNQLLNFCAAQDATFDAVWLAYIVGATDGLLVMQDGLKGGGKLCIPAGVKVEQLKDIVVRHLQAHPETRHYAAAGEVLLSLMESFGCPSNKPR